MAKRFIDTEFFKSPYVRSLEAPLKSLYCFIICDCSGAGIWAKDLEIASVYIGHRISENQWKIFVDSGKAIDLKDGKFFFPDFIEHQYPKGLSDKNPAHNNFIIELKKYGLINDALEVLPSPLKGTKVMVKVKETEKVEDKVTESEIVMPFDSENFRTQWSLWKDYKQKEFKFKFKSLQSEQAALAKLANMASSEDDAIGLMHEAMANGWKGIYPDKKPKKQSIKDWINS